MMSPSISWLSSPSEWLVASPFIICEPTASWSFELRGQHWLLVYVLSVWFAEEQKSIFSVPLRDGWAARHLGEWVTVSSSQLINYLLMQASRHQILSPAAANPWWNRWWAVMMSQVRSDVTAITSHPTVWMPDGRWRGVEVGAQKALSVGNWPLWRCH